MYTILEVVQDTGEPQFDLTTIADVKTELGITSSSLDDVLQDQVTLYSKIIASMCDRVFANQTVIETFVLGYRECPTSLPLSRFPVVAVDTVEIDGTEISAANYEADPETGLLHYICGHWYGRRVEVTYNAGYDLPDDAPAPLARACVEFVKDQRLTQGRDPSIREITDEGQTVSYFSSASVSGTGALPQTVADLIAPFRKMTA
jgi:hypothetical protein